MIRAGHRGSPELAAQFRLRGVVFGWHYIVFVLRYLNYITMFFDSKVSIAS
jgi:hypothetical protein